MKGIAENWTSTMVRCVAGRLLTCVAYVAGACCWIGCGDLPPFPGAVLTVDTELPVPKMVSRLRVDVFSEAGVWFDSRDFFLPRPSDWPTSFGLHAEEEGVTETLLVRLRAYPDGTERSYLGERFEPVVELPPSPAAPTSLEEMCVVAPPIELGSVIQLRIGRYPFAQALCGPSQAASGIAAAYVDIPPSPTGAPETYRFAVLDSQPLLFANLSLHRACEVGNTVQCGQTTGVNPHFIYPDFELPLEPGRYHLVVGSASLLGTPMQHNSPAAPADVVVTVDRADRFAPAWPPSAVVEPAVPLELQAAGRVTPNLEPAPETTIDRVVRIQLQADEVQDIGVVMRGACVGTQANLGATLMSPLADLDAAASCVATEGELVVAAATNAEPPPTQSAQGSFVPVDPCLEGEVHPRAVCVPGGAFTLGGQRGSGNEASTQPERVVRLRRFWMDQHEVTVADFRQWQLGFGSSIPLQDQPIVNNAVYPPVHSNYAQCSFSDGDMGRERHALTCVTWHFARHYCLALGGDLPTTAQFEYAAAAAWRERETNYAWGDEPPSCERAVYARAGGGITVDFCVALGFGPQPVGTAVGDATPSPIPLFGLAGGVSEWVRDAYQPYDSECWRASRINERMCWEPDAPRRVNRGGNWTFLNLDATFFHGVGAAESFSDLGFRCVYAERPL